MNLSITNAIPLISLILAAPACRGSEDNTNDPAFIAQGRETFRHETFQNESFWTDTLRMNQVIESAVDPVTALSVGLKFDADALPSGILDKADLTSPATTVALLKLDAVVGLKGTVVTQEGVDRLTRVGITCALCHSTVDDSVVPGIGKRLDGWANGDLNPGAIVALSPALSAKNKAVYSSWGRGRYDPRFNVDGLNGPVVIPPVYGLRSSPQVTYTGDGDIRYWNNYVAVTQMGGQGTFNDERIGMHRALSSGTQDMVRSKLDELRAYQFSLTRRAPRPAASTPPQPNGAMSSSSSAVPAATGAWNARRTLFMPPPTPGSMRATPIAAPPNATARHPCEPSGSIRPTSTTAARRLFPPWSITMTGR